MNKISPGDRFGSLVVFDRCDPYKGESVWSCRCDCGNSCKALQTNLVKGVLTDCGLHARRGRKRSDHTGERFGRLVALTYEFDDRNQNACWRFQCDCGNTKILPIQYVKQNRVRSCGCLRAERTGSLNARDISGQRFGRLVALRPTDRRDPTGSILWECRCDCGNTCTSTVGNLQKGRVQSCGCYYRETRSLGEKHRKDKIENTNISELVASKRIRSNNSSGTTGVSYVKRLDKWTAYISFQNKRHYLGIFSKKEDAVAARHHAEEAIHDPVILRNMDCLTEQFKERFRKEIMIFKE